MIISTSAEPLRVATNKEVLKRMPGDETIFYSEDTPEDEGDGPPLPKEFLCSLDPAGPQPGTRSRFV